MNNRNQYSQRDVAGAADVMGVALADGSYWLYEYDSLGQVTSGKKYWSDGTPVAGQQSIYSFDDIGNRKTAASGGDQFGNYLRSATYAANLLNQYTNRTVAGVNDTRQPKHPGCQ